MRIATFNVLADAYTSYGDYSHADPALMQPGARLEHIVRQVNELEADVVGLQEAELALVEAFSGDDRWQTLWAPKDHNKPDGCLTLVQKGINITDYYASHYEDDSGHVFQITQIGHVAAANTHIKWAPVDDPHHVGVTQTRELLAALGDTPQAIILADCNDRPGGPIRNLVAEAGFVNVSGEAPTAIVNQELVALDLLAVRGMSAKWIKREYDISHIPDETCASDHIPLVADVYYTLEETS